PILYLNSENQKFHSNNSETKFLIS
ncbi:uncharacterized protein METZ01_LOCUS351744, partial [marine metagenome]